MGHEEVGDTTLQRPYRKTFRIIREFTTKIFGDRHRQKRRDGGEVPIGIHKHGKRDNTRLSHSIERREKRILCL